MMRVKIAIWCGLFFLLNFTLINAQNSVRYFPPKTFDSDNKTNGFVDGWYSRQLSALQEPSMLSFKSGSDDQVYRFTWLRTFHHPIAVRVVLHKDGSGELTTKQTSGAGGYSAGSLVLNETRKLSADEIARFNNALQQSDFWRMRSLEKRQMTDGADWIFEGVKEKDYKLAVRYCAKTGSYRAMCLMMVFELAKLKVDESEVY